MDTRSVLIFGSLIVCIAATAVLVRTPSPAAVAPIEMSGEQPTLSAPLKQYSGDINAPVNYDDIHSGMFARPSSEEDSGAAQAVASASGTPHADPPIALPPSDPFADFVYSGTVTADGQKQAVLENSRTKSGDYYQQGDTVQGAVIVKIEDDAVTLNVNGRMRRIPKSTAYNVVPFDAQASVPANMKSSVEGGNNLATEGFAALYEQALTQPGWQSDLLSDSTNTTIMGDTDLLLLDNALSNTVTNDAVINDSLEVLRQREVDEFSIEANSAPASPYVDFVVSTSDAGNL